MYLLLHYSVMWRTSSVTPKAHQTSTDGFDPSTSIFFIGPQFFLEPRRSITECINYSVKQWNKRKWEADPCISKFLFNLLLVNTCMVKCIIHFSLTPFRSRFPRIHQLCCVYSNKVCMASKWWPLVNILIKNNLMINIFGHLSLKKQKRRNLKDT